MRIAAHIGVKDEIELLPFCIAHLRDLGVESFIVCDMQSTDGTLEYLRSQEGPDFQVIVSSNSEPPKQWRQRNLSVIRDSQADWVLGIDADEFPLIGCADLRIALSEADVDVFVISRYNVVVGTDGPTLRLPYCSDSIRSTLLITKSTGNAKKLLQDNPLLAWINCIPNPKVAFRPSVVANITDGMHCIEPINPLSCRQANSKNIVLAHLPLTSFARFERKVANIRDYFAYHDAELPPNFGWHWRRWVELYEHGELRKEYDRSIFSPNKIRSLVEQGVIRSGAEILSLSGS